MPTDPNTDIERETTGEPYVEGNMESDEGVAPGGSSVEDTDAISDDTPDSLASDRHVDDAADNLSIRGDDEAPDSAP
ncbi:hypothetical protein U1701_17565 [Sphingomonas sp. PB2P19]|uniref:hypothetical protein n=1 Tax=Sphingomonas rhamnosi TaxID=3096156 RepID=UPI002FC5D9F7